MAGRSDRDGNALYDEWDKRSHSSFVLFISLAEDFGHPLFFELELTPKSDRNEQECEESSVLSVAKCCAEHGEQEAGIYRVTDDTIGAAFHQFVTLLDSNRPAPVLGKLNTRPCGEPKSGTN